ncbi:MAG: F0F1 ATP synthase subunit A [Mycobacteriaceae bacterium]
MAVSGSEYHPPTLEDFYPDAVFFGGTPFELNRLMLIRLLVTALLVLFFYLAMRSPKIVPRGIQNLGEMALDFVRVQIADEILGKVNGRRFLPVLTTIFFMVLALNSTGIIPLLNISTNALIGVPLVLAVLSYVTFNYAGIKAKGFGGHMKSSLVVPNLPTPLHFIVIPIEFVSTFILRPFTLTVRLLANMLAGHILLVLFFGATSYFLFDAAGGMKIFGLPSLIMGFIFILFEMLVIVLQAYIFTLLAAVYLELAMSAEH